MTPKLVDGDDAPRRTVRHADGAWEIEIVRKKGFSTGWIIDDATGFQRLMAYSTSDQKSGRETRQFFPTLLSTGVAVPKLSVQVNYRDANLDRCEVTFIDKVELLEKLPAEAFVVAAPAGTNILDYRGIPRNELGGGRRAPSGVVSAPVPDVVAHRNRFAPAGEPVLKVGDESPPLNGLTWLGNDGQAARPALAGKIIVIDFWGLGCGPCVAQLPEVNAAAKHFADSKLVVVGLHDSSGKLEAVGEFAKKHDLAFPIAIDKPDPAALAFGATFAAFGISAIPSCVVIDGTGRVAYLGQFEHAIELANRLAQGK
jgi:peroxiredoxin